MNRLPGSTSDVNGAFVTLADGRYYAIDNVDNMPPFFISVVSDSDHWLFVASNGGLTAGRVSPDTALFPYVTVDKIYDSALYTGSKTLLSLEQDGERRLWEPFNREHDDRYRVSRNLYKHILGDRLLFEEINHDLQLAFRYYWLTSDEYGFVRRCELENLSDACCEVELLDGLQNILPAGTPPRSQANTSYLVDAYKWNELDPETGLAFYTLFSAITDRAEPCESLNATTVFSLGLEDACILLSNRQIESFREGHALTQETGKRGVRGAYLVNATVELDPEGSCKWQIVADIEQSQAQAVATQQQLRDPSTIAEKLSRSIERGSDSLARILAACDGFQATAEENVSAHHYANVLFNTLRGGVFDDQYRVSAAHFSTHVRWFNQVIYQRHQAFLKALPEQLEITRLIEMLEQEGDPQLLRLGYEYLPITFGRRHGDPSRPWNHFAIRLTDVGGARLLSYQGNWRDIFQNWEALLISYPEFIEAVITKFVNASTVDGYNPYRVTDEGIDWEVEDPDDPWSYIGYWGDHQIIYLLKLLELSRQFHPAALGQLLHKPMFSYANVPYKIKSFDQLLKDAKSTVVFDSEQAERIEKRVTELGADGKLLPDADGNVYQVNLLEKLLVSLLSKLGNLVIDGGIWLNTQRPEWNDANNALVGQGLSMVTLYYMRRYILFLQQALADQPEAIELSSEVSQWLAETAAALGKARGLMVDAPLDASLRFDLLSALGRSADHYRQTVYRQESLSGPVSQPLESIRSMLGDALLAIEHSIKSNQREDGLYNAYNLLGLAPGKLEIDTLYPMLEGQVAVLSSGAIAATDAVELLERLFDSQIFREDQDTFLLYPDRDLPGFLEKNIVPVNEVESIPLLARMLERGDHRMIEQDAGGDYRFNARLVNKGALEAVLNELAADYQEDSESAREPLQQLYEKVFKHKAFTGRSGGMFGFEGLGSVYWHMVSKLLLVVQENFFSAREQDADTRSCRKLGELYYRVRAGIGFNKTPEEYGAFPIDPYSHTPMHMGAQQPGMTGQVKEEIIARFGELGIRINAGAVTFEPGLLRAREFTDNPMPFRFLDVANEWNEVELPAASLAFTWCQVPIIYQLKDSDAPAIKVHWKSGKTQSLAELALPCEIAREVFTRSGEVSKLELCMNSQQLFPEP